MQKPRIASISDIPHLVDLMRDFYAEANYALDSEWARNSFHDLLENPLRGLVWIAFDDDLPVGHIVLTLRHSMEFGGIDGFVDDLFVKRTHRRRGFAKALLEALFSECEHRGVLAVHVETSTTNAGAVALYQSFGMADRKRLLLTRRLAAREETQIDQNMVQPCAGSNGPAVTPAASGPVPPPPGTAGR